MKKILVTGSRDHTDYDMIARTLDAYVDDTSPEDVIVIHGAATGADNLADKYAVFRGWQPARCPALWDSYAKRGGPVRNRAMAFLAPDVCFAFPLPGSRGTWDMVARAHEMGIPVKVVSAETGAK